MKKDLKNGIEKNFRMKNNELVTMTYDSDSKEFRLCRSGRCVRKNKDFKIVEQSLNELV